MSIPITVDNITYKSTNALIKALNLSVKESVLYNHYTRDKHTFTLDEIKEAERWINDNVKLKKSADDITVDNINLADIFFNKLYLTKDKIPALDEFIMALPIQESSEDYFIQYTKANYPKIKDCISKIPLDYLLKTIHYYKLNKLYTDNTTVEENTPKIRITIKGKTINEYAKQYDVSYNTVWYVYKEIINCSYYTEDLFIERLEEKAAEVIQRRNKKKN